METLHLTESGARGAPTIIILHGIGAAGWMWCRQIAALSNFHCLAVDLPGHGKSNHIPWTSFADTAERVAEIIQARATDGIAHVVGLSLGGHLLLELLARHHRVVDRAIVSGVTSKPMPNLAFLNPQLWVVSSLMHQPWVMNRAMRSMQVPADMEDDFRTNLLAMAPRTYRRIFEQAAHWNVPTSLSAVTNPTLVVAGGAEPKIIIEAVDAIADLLPNGEGRLAPGLHHGWNIEDPALFNAMVRALMQGSPLPARLGRIQSA